MKRRTGISAAEVVVAAFVGAAIAVPLLTLLYQGRDAGQRSRFEYVALLAARDTMYESRFLAASGTPPENLQCSWRQLEGSAFGVLGAHASGLKVPFEYKPEQARIRTELELLSSDGRQKVGRVRVRWAEPGPSEGASGANAPEAQPDRPSQVELVFGMMWPPWAEKP